MMKNATAGSDCKAETFKTAVASDREVVALPAVTRKAALPVVHVPSGQSVFSEMFWRDSS